MDDERLRLLLNEWKRRFQADPDSFSGTFSDTGDYGAHCVSYLHELDAELKGESSL